MSVRAQALIDPPSGRGVADLLPARPVAPEDLRSGEELADRLWRRLTWASIAANCLGALDLVVFLALLLGVGSGGGRVQTLANVVGGACYTAITLYVGNLLGIRRNAPFYAWLRSGRPPTAAERDGALRVPLDFALSSAGFWFGAALLFGVGNALVSPAIGAVFAATIALGGLSTSAVAYLIVERIMRPATARALAVGPPPQRRQRPGVAARLTMAWMLATGVPLLGVVTIAVARLAGGHIGSGSVVAASAFLAAAGLVVGLLATVVAARSVADPLAGMRDALARVEGGELDARVPVDDGSEVGLLQAGFNRMALGLAERERMRELFGRHVGEDVARAALDGEVKLGGEEREVAALFIDIVGSTALAAARPPAEVVALLNRFFEVVVEVVEAHGGLVNKFEGDAALCVFGAPVRIADPAGGALAAARELRRRLRAGLAELDFGAGVSAGIAVAGNVGAEQRYEYTVIGDPINEAARLCELAKSHPERLLCSAGALDRADGDEARRWALSDRQVLRGREAPTQIATASV